MKKLEFKLDMTDIKLDDADKEKSVTELIVTLLKNVCLVWGQETKRGMVEEDRRLYYKVCDDLDKAVKDKATFVDLEDDRASFIRKCFREATLMPNNLLLRRIEELVWTLKGE